MKNFKDLIVKQVTGGDLKLALVAIKEKLPKNWKSRFDLEPGYSKNVSKDISEIGCFESPEILGKTALVWVVKWGNELKIVNIVPTNTFKLNYDEYNAILDKFNAECISPILDRNTFSISISPGNYNIREIAGENTYAALVKWESTCNHSTGNTHASDFDLWANFVSIAQNEHSKLTPDLLNRWLVEERNWNKDADVTLKIVQDYEYSLSLLEHYGKN